MASKTMASPELPQDEHVLLDDNKYIADVLCEFKNAKAGKVRLGFHSPSAPVQCFLGGCLLVLGLVLLVLCFGGLVLGMFLLGLGWLGVLRCKRC